MAVEQEVVKQQVDAIVQAIGFGIVSDFQQLRSSMRSLWEDATTSISYQDQINSNLSATDKQLTQFERDTYRRRDAREFKKLEDEMEKNSRLTKSQSDSALQKILSTIEAIKSQVGQSSGSGSSFGETLAEGAALRQLTKGAGTAGATAGAAEAAAAGGAAAGAGAGAGAGAAAGTAGTMGAVGEVAAVTGAGYGAQQVWNQAVKGPSAAQAAQAAVKPAEMIAPQAAETAQVAANLQRTGGAMKTQVGRAMDAAKNQVGGVIKTTSAKALEKVAAKIPSYLSKNAARVVATIGAKNVPVLGAIVGGWFAMERFFAGDSWTAIGAEFVSGVAPEIGATVGALGGPVGAAAGFAAGVATSIAIQAYLICRDIYTEENAAEIKNGTVKNFDDLTMAERAGVIKACGQQLAAYVNKLLGISKKEDSAKTAVSTTQATTAAAAAGATAAATSNATQPKSDANTAQTQDKSGGDPNIDPSTGMTVSPEAEPVAGSNQSKDLSGGDQSKDPSTGMVVAPTPSSMTSQATPAAPPPAASTPVSPTETSSGYTPAPQPEAQTGPSDNVASFGTRTDQVQQIPGSDSAVVEVLETGPGWNKVRLADGSIVKRSGDRNWRNNNPGNIEYGEFTKSHGAIGSDGRFAIFPTVEDGRAAKQALLFEGKNYKDKTIAEAIYRWAPPSDGNPTNAYIAQAARGAGVDPNTPLADLTPEQRSSMMDAMARVEGMRPGKTEVIEGTKSANVAALAEGGMITPLPSDKPKPGTNLEDLEPPPNSTVMSSAEQMDQNFESSSSSSQVIDARSKPQTSPSNDDPKQSQRNKLHMYHQYMDDMFNRMTKELKAHMNGEVTEEHAFEQAMNPMA